VTNQKAISHFKHLYDLLLNMQVTDGQGAALSLDEGAGKAVDIILSVGVDSRKVMVIGNGGSAAIASHMQSDLCKAAEVRAMVFNEVPLLTALTNDHGYQYVFERPVSLWADTGDLIVAISSSGKSDNILRAVRAAMARGCRSITLSGFSVDNPLRHLGDVNFYVPSPDYGYVESAHAVLAHFLTDCVAKSQSSKGDSCD
jgi:D-sedoheptulose 7-phosphate isomerase